MSFSQRYTDEMEALTEYFKERLPVCGPVTLTRDEYGAGTDSLTGLHKLLVGGAFVEWLAVRNYELSYNQGCNAFFAAARLLGLLTVSDESDATHGATAHP